MKDDSPTNGAIANEPKRGLALLFPGQGTQRVGMGKRIADISEAARKIFAQADDVADSSISRLCFDGPQKELDHTANAQPAILTTSLAYLAFLRERLQEMGQRLKPGIIAGHSMGEVSAAVAAGAIDLGDGIRLVRERGRLMGEWAKNRPGGVASVLGLEEKAVREICDEAAPGGTVGVAVINGPGHTVISGDAGPLASAMALAKERGARVLRLSISVPGHTPHLRDVAQEMSRFMDALPFRDPNPPMVSNISATILTTADEVREELSNHIYSAVEWARCVVTMLNEGSGPFVEVGASNALTNLVRRIKRDAEVYAADSLETDEQFAKLGDAPVALPSVADLA